MIAKHISVETDPELRGLAFGRAQRAGVETTAHVYERLLAEQSGIDDRGLAELGSRVADRLARSRPGLATEIAAIARGAAVGVKPLMAINARTELLAGASRPECSVIGLLPPRAEGAILAQNWDWHPDLAAARVLWTIHDAKGGWCTTLTEAGIVGKIGINSRRLGVCLNLLGSSLDGGVDGTPIHVLLRAVLEECGSVEEAEQLLRAEFASASSAISIGGAEADGRIALAAFEVSPGGVARVDPIAGALVHTNHFIAPLAAARDVMRETWPDSVARLEELSSRLEAWSAPVDARAVKSLLRSHLTEPVSVCSHDRDNPHYPDRQVTLASVLIDLDRGLLTVADGSPCEAAHEPVVLPPYSAMPRGAS